MATESGNSWLLGLLRTMFQSEHSDHPVRRALNFGADFVVTDDSVNDCTTVDLAVQPDDGRVVGTRTASETQLVDLFTFDVTKNGSAAIDGVIAIASGSGAGTLQIRVNCGANYTNTGGVVFTGDTLEGTANVLGANIVAVGNAVKLQLFNNGATTWTYRITWTKAEIATVPS